MPESEITATSVVPPPISTTMFPEGSGDGQPRADSRHHRLFHQVDFARLRAVGRIHDRALFHLRNFARHADHNSRMHQHFPPMRFLNKVIQHALGDFEIGDNAVFHGLNCDDIAGGAAQHFLGFLADGFHFTRVFIDGNNGWLVDNDAFALGVHQGIGCSQIYSEVR